MPSSFSQNLGIELPADGELDGLWGDVVNENMNILDRAINGTVTLTLTGTASTLTTSDGVLSDGQYKLLVLGGTPSGTHTITIAPNDAQKIYFVRNTTAQSVVFTQGSGGNVTIATGDSGIIYANGGGGGAAVVNLTDHFAMSSVKITGGSITGITDLAVADGGTGASDAATARTNLGLAIGTNVQAWDANLDQIAALAPTADNFIVGNGSAWTLETPANALLSLGVTATAAELNYVDGVTSAIQTQLNAKQPLDADLTAIAALAVTDGNFIVGNGTTWVAESGATARTSLGLGSIATQASSSVAITGGSIAGITDLAVADGGTGASDAATARTNLGLAIGTNVQAYDAGLQSISGLTTAANQMIYTTAADTYAVTTLTAAGRALLDDTNAAAQRTTLGLGTLATQSGTFSGTSSGTNTGDQSIFQSIAVAGQTTVVADSTADTLTLAAGSGVTITTNATTDTITIAATGSGGTVTSVGVSGGTTGLTTSGGPITGSGTITLAGTLALANGGTGATTAANARTNLGAQATITGAATTITSSNLTASRALASDGSGKVAVSATTATELGYVSGVTSAIQTQINTKANAASPSLSGTITITGGTQNWTVVASGTNLTFAYNGVNVMRLTSAGDITVIGNVTAYGTL